MTINDFHINFNLGTQEIASFQVDNILPQEIDHYLNSAMDRFIKQRYGKLSNMKFRGFEESQKRIDDLRSLVVPHTAQTFYIGETFSTPKFKYFVERAELPMDYLFLVNARAEVYYSCNSLQNIEEETTTYNYVTIQINPPSAGLLLTDVKIELYSGQPAVPVISNNNGVTENQLRDATNWYTGKPIESIPGVNTAQNTAEGTPTSESSIIYLELGDSFSGSLVVTQNWVHPTTGVITTTTNATLSTITKKVRTTSDSTKKINAKLSFAQHDDIYTLLEDPFNTTSYNNPTFTMEENFVDVYSDENFIVSSIHIKYIRRPLRMDKINGIGCELPEHTHQEILDMAIKSYLGDIQDPRYEVQARKALENE